MGQITEAIELFRSIISCETDIKEYTHLPPHAALELGLAYRKLGELDEAKFWLNKSIYEYTNYMNATTVHIRAHTAMTIIRSAEEEPQAAEVVYTQFEEKLKQLHQESMKNEEFKQSMPHLDPSLEVEDLS